MDDLSKQITAESELFQRKLNKQNKHYKILDALITAAQSSDDALLIARHKIQTGRNGNANFREMAVKLEEEQLIKLRSDLKLVDFF